MCACVRTVALKIVEFCTSLGGNLKKREEGSEKGTTFRGILKVEEKKKLAIKAEA